MRLQLEVRDTLIGDESPLIGGGHLQLEFLSPGGIFYTIWGGHNIELHQKLWRTSYVKERNSPI